MRCSHYWPRCSEWRRPQPRSKLPQRGMTMLRAGNLKNASAIQFFFCASVDSQQYYSRERNANKYSCERQQQRFQRKPKRALNQIQEHAILINEKVVGASTWAPLNL